MPRNLSDSVVEMSLPEIDRGDLGCGFRLKSMIISWVFAVLSRRLFSEHQVTA